MAYNWSVQFGHLLVCMQHRTRWEHWVPLLPDSDALDGQLHGQQRVSTSLHLGKATWAYISEKLHGHSWLYSLFFICSKVLALEFDDKFIRTWEYYFVYTAAGFKSRTLGNYQVLYVFTYITVCPRYISIYNEIKGSIINELHLRAKLTS